MQVIDIVPIRNLSLMEDQRMAMFLTHLVQKYPGYAQYASAFSGYKILDNSLIEVGDALDIMAVHDAAVQITADELILPDVFRKGEATYKEVEKALEFYRNGSLEKKHKFMAVCQGKDPAEFAWCFAKLKALEEIDVIGIPKVCAKMLPEGRPGFEWLWQQDCTKEIHLLGLWYSYEELARYRHPEKIRSMDTCLASFFAKHNLGWNGMRPDGFTVNLEEDVISGRAFQECRFYR